MIITEHAQLRYIERVMGIYDSKKYLSHNKGYVLETLNNWTTNAKILAKSYKRANVEKFNYVYAYGNYILIASESSKELVTLWKNENPKLTKKIRQNLHEIGVLENNKKPLDLRNHALKTALEWAEINLPNHKEMDSVKEMNRELNEVIEKTSLLKDSIRALKRENREMVSFIVEGFNEGELEDYQSLSSLSVDLFLNDKKRKRKNKLMELGIKI